MTHTEADTHSWWEVCVQVPGDLADDAAGLLVMTGATGAQILVAPNPDTPTLPTETPPPDPGCARILATFESGDGPTLSELCRTTLSEVGIQVRPDDVAVRQRSDSGWKTRWKEFFRPLRVGRFWVVPAWDETAAPSDTRWILRLEPGLAFGTGQHATTALCLEVLDRAVTPDTKTLLDVGCGSGILSFAARMLGVPEVTAIDNDPVACRVARESLELNPGARPVNIQTTPVDELSGTYDWVVANILASILLDIRSALLARVRPGGKLLLSGLLTSQVEELMRAFGEGAQLAGRGTRLLNQHQRDDWSTLLLEVE